MRNAKTDGDTRETPQHERQAPASTDTVLERVLRTSTKYRREQVAVRQTLCTGKDSTIFCLIAKGRT
jgi:hypothetical protein